MFPVGAVAPLLLACQLLQAQATPELRRDVDSAVRGVIEKTGVPSATVGIVQGGKIVYTAGYGKARLEPELAATATMRYPVGSISKQFTAAGLLLLVEDGKMSLDDPVAKWFPELTRAKDITVRMLLSHTSGYRDNWPEDYMLPSMLKPTSPLEVVKAWATKPLDFEPGTRWQYSNTNFMLAALILERVSGTSFWQLIETRLLAPAGMKSTINLDTDRAKVEPQGYLRHALGPLRPAPAEAAGWAFGAGALAMNVGDLLTWDLNLMHRSVLRPESWGTLEREVKLSDGSGTGYGLGVDVRLQDGHRVIAHSGEVGGFVAQDTVYPDDGVATAVLTNQEASGAAAEIAQALTPILLKPTAPATSSTVGSLSESQVRSLLADLKVGHLNRSLLAPNCNFYFSEQTVADFASSLGPLGEIGEVKQRLSRLRGGMTFQVFEVSLGQRKLEVTTYTLPDGKIEQFLVESTG